MDEKKKETPLDQLEQFVFKMMVDTQVDLLKAGFYENPEVEPEDFSTTPEQDGLLQVMETCGRIMQKIMQLQGNDNAEEILLKEMTANSMAELILEEKDEKWKAFAEDYWKNREAVEAEWVAFLNVIQE